MAPDLSKAGTAWMFDALRGVPSIVTRSCLRSARGSVEGQQLRRSVESDKTREHTVSISNDSKSTGRIGPTREKMTTAGATRDNVRGLCCESVRWAAVRSHNTHHDMRNGSDSEGMDDRGHDDTLH